MSGSETKMEEDTPLSRKRKWIEATSDALQLGRDAKRRRASPAEQQAAMSELYDDLMKNEAFASKEAAQPEDGMSVDAVADEQPADPQEALLRAVRYESDDEELTDAEIKAGVVMEGINPANEIPASKGKEGRRILRVRHKAKPLLDPVSDPKEEATLLQGRPAALGGRDSGKRERVVTAYGLLAQMHRPKNASKDQATKMPDMVVLPQTKQLREAYEKLSEEQREQTDYDFFLFDDPDEGKAGAKGRDLSRGRLSSPLQGPHTVAHIALTTAMRQRKAAAKKAGTAAEQNEARRAQIDEILALGHVMSPEEVRGVLMEEEPGLYASSSTPMKPVFAETTSEERRARIARYSNGYTEIYNQVVSIVAQLSDVDGAKALDETVKGRALDTAYDRIEELMNLSPYQSYGWREKDAVIEKKEIAGKGEGKMVNRMYRQDKATEELSADQNRVSGMARLVDGLDPKRMFKNPERYRDFLVQRIEFLLGDDADAYTASALRKYELDDLYNMMIDEKIARLEVEKLRRAR